VNYRPIAVVDEAIPPSTVIDTVPEYATTVGRKQRAKTDIRRSLEASTLDGVFAAVFSNLTGGVLLSNLLVNLQATSFEIGILASIPMLANFVQPVGAWLGDRFPSRHYYCAGVYFPSRLVWGFLLVGIGLYANGYMNRDWLVGWTMVVAFASHLMGGLGSAAWLSWMAALVPKQLRGRYFSIRNSAANLTSLIAIALAGFWVANYPRGELEGFGIALGIGILAGILSLAFQWQMVDVNPQGEIRSTYDRENPNLREDKIESIREEVRSTELILTPVEKVEPAPEKTSEKESFLATLVRDRNLQGFLLYFGVWMFAINLSAPFFNVYLLQNLHIDVGWVTLYNSLASGANLAFMIPFGRWSDKIGNRLLLLTIGFVMAALPIFWLGTGVDTISLWVGLPLLFMLNGMASGAIDLCGNNLQLEIAPENDRAKYFGITAAVAGVSGALGTIAGGGLAQWDAIGGTIGLFAISTVIRLFALVPLLFLQEERHRSFGGLFQPNL
jgi:MFS family permease